MDRKSIVVCDDQHRFREDFIKRHGDHYDVTCVTDTRELFRALERSKHLPDLLLLDVYYPKDDTEQEKKAELAEASLEKLDRQIEETNAAVLAAWEPGGLPVVKLLRERYSADVLPITFYTQKGLVLLSDDELREARENDVDFLLKKKLSTRTEQVWIDRMMRRESGSSTTTIYRWILAISWFIIGLLASRSVLNTNQVADVLGNIIAGMVVAVVSYFLLPWLTNKLNERS